MTLYLRKKKKQCRKTACSLTEYVGLFEINILNLDYEKKF